MTRRARIVIGSSFSLAGALLLLIWLLVTPSHVRASLETFNPVGSIIHKLLIIGGTALVAIGLVFHFSGPKNESA